MFVFCFFANFVLNCQHERHRAPLTRCSLMLSSDSCKEENLTDWREASAKDETWWELKQNSNQKKQKTKVSWCYVETKEEWALKNRTCWMYRVDCSNQTSTCTYNMLCTYLYINMIKTTLFLAPCRGKVDQIRWVWKCWVVLSFQHFITQEVRKKTKQFSFRVIYEE